jgi:hypothetical protein
MKVKGIWVYDNNGNLIDNDAMKEENVKFYIHYMERRHGDIHIKITDMVEKSD